MVLLQIAISGADLFQDRIDVGAVCFLSGLLALFEAADLGLVPACCFEAGFFAHSLGGMFN
jgi:hypothetical protein